MSGWIKIHRSIIENPLWTDKPFSRGQAWIDILLRANYDDKEIMLGGNIKKVNRGSFITSELKLMDRWGWSKKKVRAFLSLLESENMIERYATQKGTTINVVNYSVYQDLGTVQEPLRNHIETVERLSGDSGGYTDKEIKNKRNKEIYRDDKSSLRQTETIRRVVDAWNSLSEYGIRRISRLNSGSKRYSSLISRLNEYGEAEVMRAIENIKHSDFLQGKEHGKSWVITFDWFVLPSNFPKVLEGNYDNREKNIKKPNNRNNNNFERRNYDMDKLERQLMEGENNEQI